MLSTELRIRSNFWTRAREPFAMPLWHYVNRCTFNPVDNAIEPVKDPILEAIRESD